MSAALPNKESDNEHFNPRTAATLNIFGRPAIKVVGTVPAYKESI